MANASSVETVSPETIQLVVSTHQSLLEDNIRAFRVIKSRVDTLLASSAVAECQGMALVPASNHRIESEFPVLTLSLVLFGCFSIVAVAFREWTNFNTQRAIADEASDNKDYWTKLAVFLQYRLDFFLSVSPLSKPIFLLTLSFVIILISSLALVLFTGEEFSAAFWLAWTYVADSGGSTLVCSKRIDIDFFCFKRNSWWCERYLWKGHRPLYELGRDGRFCDDDWPHHREHRRCARGG